MRPVLRRVLAPNPHRLLYLFSRTLPSSSVASCGGGTIFICDSAASTMRLSCRRKRMVVCWRVDYQKILAAMIHFTLAKVIGRAATSGIQVDLRTADAYLW
ncbi:hypothetical protein BDV98DRAFT_566787 [Pterulicium gracile]|uniref:Uncharacterized protein n=1 Tax=Pterulicium gracile TaxID=1884261 RepID=A0A5C3QNP7_9AGAR|nr:hypothetical protein BDV98DRAFT_566787 [Pterula gracilis]